MRSNRKTFPRATMFLSVLALLLCPLGCSSETTPMQRAAKLEDRVREVWDCRLRGDYGTKYDLMSPDIRTRMSKNEFINSKGFVSYYSYEILALEIDEDEAIAEVKYTWKANHPLFQKAPVKENVTRDPWVFLDGQWYMKYRKPSLTGAQDAEIQDRAEPDDDLN